MNNRLKFTTLGALFLGWLASIPTGTSVAQSPSKPVSVDGGNARKLASGVLTVVAPNPQPEDTSLGPMELDFVKNHPELTWTAPDFPENAPFFNSPSQTLLAMGRDVHLRHTVFALEFGFKTARTIEVDVTSSDGNTTRQLVWYLLYRVRYLGGFDLTPNLSAVEAGTGIPGEPKRTGSDAVLFVPKFTLIAGPEGKEFNEKIIPSAKRAIAARERVGKPLYDSFEMIRRIKQDTETEPNELWGIATWINVDPRIDYFAIQVEGITNAYRVQIDGDQKKFQKKVLQINFWRPGDSIAAQDDRIRLGVPAFEDPVRVQYALEQLGLKERLDYFWTYR